MQEMSRRTWWWQ